MIIINYNYPQLALYKEIQIRWGINCTDNTDHLKSFKVVLAKKYKQID